MTSLKVAARKAFLEEPPFPRSAFENFERSYVKELEEHMRNASIPRTKIGWTSAVDEMLRFLRGETQ